MFAVFGLALYRDYATSLATIWRRVLFLTLLPSIIPYTALPFSSPFLGDAKMQEKPVTDATMGNKSA